MKKFFNFFLIFITVAYLATHLIELINSKTVAPDFIDEYTQRIEEQSQRSDFQNAKDIWEDIKKKHEENSQQNENTQNNNQQNNNNQSNNQTQQTNDDEDSDHIWVPENTQILDDEQSKDTAENVPYIYYDYHLLLNDTERELYLELWDGLKKGDSTVSTDAAPNLDVYEALRVAQSVVADHPEYFWLSYRINARKSGNTTTINFIPYAYWRMTVNPSKYTDGFSSKLQRLTSETMSQSGDDAKIQYIHDYLVRNVTYDHPSMDESIDYTLNNENSRYAFTGTAYGAIMNSSAICAGYAKAFQVVLQNAGYTVGYLTGSVDGAAHAWNRIYRNNQVLYYDVTFDDLGDFYAYPNDLSYTYYGITQSQIDKTHVAD